jgi:lysophospholipase L1-like esterase
VTDSPTSLNRRQFVSLASATAAAAALTPSLVQALPTGPAAATTGGAGGIVLFQGDSVTDNGRSKNRPMANDASALGNGYPLMVSSQVLRADASSPWQFFNRGISGNKIPDLDARWDADCLAIKPDILSILIGINDYWHTKTLGYKGTTAEFESGFIALIDRTKKALPSVRLVIMEPFVLKVGAVDDSWYPAFPERQGIVARIAKTVGATFVPLQDPFDRAAKATGPAHWAADGVHPTPAGHALIAERWRAAVKL